MRIGTTQNVIGVYQIVYIIQKLAEWARDTYWPWFRKHALRVSPPTVVPESE